MFPFRMRHQCLVSNRGDVGSNPITCPLCQKGHPSYFAYMDHLQSTPCGIRHQQAFNHPQLPQNGPLPSYEWPGMVQESRNDARRGAMSMFPNRRKKLDLPPPPPQYYYNNYGWPHHPHHYWQRPQFHQRHQHTQPLTHPWQPHVAMPIKRADQKLRHSNTTLGCFKNLAREAHEQQNDASNGQSELQLERPERPSSDDEVIMAAAEVVAREKGLLPTQGPRRTESWICPEERSRHDATEFGSRELLVDSAEAARLLDLGLAIDDTVNNNNSDSKLLVECPVGESSNKKDSSSSESWIDQVFVSGSDGEFVPINIEDIAQVVEVDEDGSSSRRACLKEGSTDPVLGETAPATDQRRSFTSAVSKVASAPSTTNIIETETITLHFDEDNNDTPLFDVIYLDKEGLKSNSEFNLEHCICPHRAVCDLEPISLPERARDQMTLTTLQAKLEYVLVGLLGDTCLTHYGYPYVAVVRILHRILDLTGIKVIEENYLCTSECSSLEKSIGEQDQLSCRLVKLRIRVIRANVEKLLCLCVPEREKWREFGWIGKSVDEILEDLTSEDIPAHRPKEKACATGDKSTEDEQQQHHPLQKHEATKQNKATPDSATEASSNEPIVKIDEGATTS